ncbi:MAG: CBS domain-containing protein [Planctomycetota bacterium]|jgi:CBS domain-containing protein
MSFLDTTHVHDLMIEKVMTVCPDDALLVAARLMHSSRISCVVVDSGDPATGFGVLTQKDLVQRWKDYGPVYPGLKVRDAMSSPCMVLTPNLNISTAVDMMRMIGVRRAPVAADGKLLGLLSFSDIFRWSMNKLERSAA